MHLSEGSATRIHFHDDIMIIIIRAAIMMELALVLFFSQSVQNQELQGIILAQICDSSWLASS